MCEQLWASAYASNVERRDDKMARTLPPLALWIELASCLVSVVGAVEWLEFGCNFMQNVT